MNLFGKANHVLKCSFSGVVTWKIPALFALLLCALASFACSYSSLTETESGSLYSAMPQNTSSIRSVDDLNHTPAALETTPSKLFHCSWSSGRASHLFLLRTLAATAAQLFILCRAYAILCKIWPFCVQQNLIFQICLKSSLPARAGPCC